LGFEFFLDASASDQSEQDRNDRYHKKDVNDTTNAKYEGSEYPSNDQDYG
jgi:hypothetical protein